MREFLDLPGHIEEEIRFGACEFRSYQVEASHQYLKLSGCSYTLHLCCLLPRQIQPTPLRSFEDPRFGVGKLNQTADMKAAIQSSHSFDSPASCINLYVNIFEHGKDVNITQNM